MKLGKQAAEKLAEASAEFNREELAIAAVSLLEYPQLLKRLETKKPETATALQDQLSRLSVFMCEHHGSGHETLLWLAESEQLLPTTMALLGDERFISEIGRSEEAASEHRRTFLAGCKRACGGPVGEQLMVDADHPVEFRPKSAWPESDDRRQSSTSSGHGDGYVEVMLTGEIRGDDGTHPVDIQFFRTNDSMLLGLKRNIPEDVIYDPETGRFVFYTTVFAAYDMGNDQPEPGPYQTGSTQIRIEATGFESLALQFFDEMPDVVITLNSK